jgi:hypothetical protein
VGDSTTRACLHFATSETLLGMANESGGGATCPRVMARVTEHAPEAPDGPGDVLESEAAEVTVEVFDHCRAEITPSVFGNAGFTTAGRCMMQRYVCIMPTRQM